MRPGRLQIIAEKMLKLSLHDQWRPQTRDIQKRYKLNEKQADTVKKHTKKLAANLGVIWGYDPEVEYFRVAPDNVPEVAKRMLKYQLRHWKDAGNSTAYLFDGALKQGYVTREDTKIVKDLDQEFTRRITLIEDKVKSL